MIRELKDQSVFINYGPIQMVLDISTGSQKQPELGFVVAQHLIDQFHQLTEYMTQLKTMRAFKKPEHHLPKVLNKMVTAITKIDDETLNTLSAVAGSFSDIALEMALELGATRVIINNGGDIALRDISGAPITVGIPLSRELSETKIILSITEEQKIFGICTSGHGGRSFTKGIATAAVVLATDAATADACATYIGNHTNVEDDNIIRCFAEEIDSGTDIAGQLVTLKVGDLSTKKKYTALLNGLNAAEDLCNKKIIKGAILCIGKDIVKLPHYLEIKTK